MKVRTIVALTAATISLLGCATPATNTAMPESVYEKLAIRIVGLRLCGTMGYMAPETAARGIAEHTRAMNTWSYDPAKMSAAIDEWTNSGQKPTREMCNSAAVGIAEKAQKDEANQRIAQGRQEEMNQIMGSFRAVPSPSLT
ncbi:MAG: hypothetical protein IV103_14000 [Zoogloea sp.]|nr:hypothetical protein [Zoogloea sp.]